MPPYDEPTPVTLARIETKLDIALSDVADHETRIRALEQRPPGITGPRMLTAAVGVGSLCASVGAVVALLAR